MYVLCCHRVIHVHNTYICICIIWSYICDRLVTYMYYVVTA